MRCKVSCSMVFRFVFAFLMAIFIISPSWSQAVSSVFSTSSIYSITWGNGKFVAVGDNGKIASSSDGITWSLVTNSIFDNSKIFGITFGNGKFVAVGENGKIAFSPDGASWTDVSGSFGNSQINDITFGIGLFVAVGNDNKIASSPDGIVWNLERNSPFNNDDSINNIAFGDGKFVISRWGRIDAIAISTDIKNWILAETSYVYGFPFISDIAYGNGQFIAVGNTGNDSGFLFTSNNGLMWTKQDSSFHPQAGDITTAAWGNGRFIAVGSNGALAVSDSNAENWGLLISNSGSASRPISRDHLFSIIYANEIFIGVGANGKISTSPDGINWVDLRTSLGDFHYDGFHYTERSGGIIILNYIGTAENVIIPTEINGKPVMEIAERAFYYKYGMTGVTIPDSVISIGNSAFSSSRLTSVIIGNGVTSIGSFAFQSNRLINVTIGNNVSSIGQNAFSGNPIQNITVSPDNTRYTINGFFFLSKDEKELILYFGNEETVNIPNSVTSIGYAAFDNYQQITSVTIGADIRVVMGSIPGRFFQAYDAADRQAGTYVRSNANSFDWERR